MSYFGINEPLEISESDPISQHYVFETLVDEESVDDDTHYYYVDMAGYRGLSLQFELVCDTGTITCTVEGSIQSDGTAAASCDYQDITSDTFGITNVLASGIASSDMLIDDSGKTAAFKYVRVKVVTNTGDDADTDVTIYSKKWY